MRNLIREVTIFYYLNLSIMSMMLKTLVEDLRKNDLKKMI
jgi:hypothetical protein